MDTFRPGSISPLAVIAADVELGVGVTVGPFAVIHSGVQVGDRTFVGPHCVLGEPVASFYESASPPPPAPCRIGADSIIRSHCVIYQGVTTGTRLQLGHRVTIREDSMIGSDVRIGTMSDLQGALTIDDHVRLHSNVHVGQFSVVERFAWLFPYVVLTNDPHPPSETCLRGPVVGEFAVIATMAVLMPGVEIGRNALVGAVSLVTRDVPEETVVVGSPAREVGSVRDVTCRHGALDHVYPWPRQFRRGYGDGILPAADSFDEGD